MPIFNKHSLLHPHKRKVRRETPRPMVAMTFDDGFLTDYTNAYPLMTEKGIKGTSYITTNWVGNSGFMTWDNIRELRDNGWDIQCHTHTHPPLGQRTEEEIRYEIETLNASFLANGFELPSHHAYPYGSTSAIARAVLSEYRLTMRRTTNPNISNINYRNSVDPLSLRGLGVDIQTVEHLNRIKANLLETKNTGGMVILFAHEIIQSPGDLQYKAVESYLADVFNYINEIGIESVTISEMYESLNV